MALELFLTEHIPPTQAHHQGWPARDYHHVRFFDDDYYYLGRLDHPFSYRLTWLLCYIMCCWNGAALSLRQNDVVQGASKFLTYLLGGRIGSFVSALSEWTTRIGVCRCLFDNCVKLSFLGHTT